MAFFKKRNVAVICMILLIVGSIFIGTRIGLYRKYIAAKDMFYNGEENDGVSIQKDLQARIDEAKKLMKTAVPYQLDTVDLQTVIEALNATDDIPLKFKYNSDLTTEVQNLYAQLKALDTLNETDKSYLVGIMTELKSRNITITYNHAYNDLATSYNKALDIFPVNMMKNMLGLEELPYFR